MLVTNRTRNTVLGDAVDLADTSEKRRTGLLALAAYCAGST